MLGAISPSNQLRLELPRGTEAPRLERLRGAIDLAFRGDLTGSLAPGRTRIERLYQSGSARVRLPRAHTDALEAILINTGGGLTGGDEVSIAVDVAEHARAIVTTQAAEKVYRSAAGEAKIRIRIEVADRGRLEWLPQETILFEGSRLNRHIEVDLAPAATLLMVEATLLGRTESGERMTRGSLRDTWRIRRAGRLIFAEAMRLDGDIAGLLKGITATGGRPAIAIVLYVLPDAEQMLEKIRELLAALPGEGGATAFRGMLLVRLTAETGQRLKQTLVRLLESLRGLEMPRVWNC